MLNLKILNKEGKEVGDFELDENIFAAKIREDLVHQAVVHYLANQRQGTKSAKTRSEVRGGGRKPWRQKGTGRARHGSTRSPIWKGGGVIFAPKPRDYSFKMNKKVKRLALKSALSSKVQNENLIILEDFSLEMVKTKDAAEVLKLIGADNALIVINDNDKNAYLSLRNIPSVKTCGTFTINTYDIIKYNKLIITKESLEKIQEVYV